ncbi:hypothetical protein LTS10_013288 [Elasticomyces elasticus]|nr:hypothetical protein LTS10_013288 [Elasticomyces elasticus]
MATCLRRPSVPRLNKYFEWPSRKEFTDAGVIEEIGARALENLEWRKDITDVTLAQDKASIAPRAMRLAPSNSTHDLAVFLRTTGPRGRESLRASSSTCRRSKSLPRRLLDQLREYWKPTPEEVGLPASISYKYDERLQAWVRGLPIDAAQQSSSQVPNSIVQKTTSKGHKYFELKGLPSPRTDGVFSRGDDWSSIYEKPLADELDRLVLRDLTSDDLMDGWLADPGEKLDSCSDSAHHSFPPSPIVSAAGARLSLLLPSTQADDSVVASKTLAPTRASSTTGGRLSIWAPAALSRDSVSTVVRHPGAASESHEWDGNMRLVTDDRRASLWELEDTGMQDVDDTPVPGIGNDNHGVGGVSIPRQESPRSPKSASPVPLDGDHPSVLNHEVTGRTFYTSDDSDLDAPIGIPLRERRDTEPSSGRTVLSRGSYRSNSFDEVSHRGSISAAHVSRPHDHGPGNQVPVGQRRPKGLVRSLSSNEVIHKHPSSATRYVAPKYSPEARDFFMQEINDDAARLSHTTRSALLYVKISECVFCDPCIEGAEQGTEVVARHWSNDDGTGGSSVGTNATRTSDDAARAQAISPMPFTYRPTGPFSSETDLIETKPLPKAPVSAATKIPHISTLSRSTSSLHTNKTRPSKYTKAPTPSPERSLPALPSSAKHPGLRAERGRVGVPPQSGTHELAKIKRKPLVSVSAPTPRLRKAQPYRGADLRSLGTQQVIRPAGDCTRRLADMKMLEGQLCEIQSEVIQLSAMVVEVLTRQYEAAS